MTDHLKSSGNHDCHCYPRTRRCRANPSNCSYPRRFDCMRKLVLTPCLLVVGFLPTQIERPSVAQSAPTINPLDPEKIKMLNPNPNLLQRPTQPEDITLKGTYAITLEQAVELAFRNNLPLQNQGVTLEKSQAALQEAKAALYPTISLQGGLSRQETFDLSNEFSITSSEGSSNALAGTVSVSYDLFTSGQRPATIRGAQQQVKFNEMEVAILTEQTLQDVSNDYYSLQNADEQVRIQKSAVANAQESYRITTAREMAGVGTGFDVLQSKVQLSNAIQAVTNAQNNQKTARRQLAQRLNVSQNADLAAADPVRPAGGWPLTLEQSIVLAFKNRLELEQFLVQKEISRQNRKAALGALGPRLSLSGSWDLNNAFGDRSTWSSGYSVGANVQWTGFDGGAARAKAKQSEQDMKSAEFNFANTRNQIRFNVEQAYFSLQSNANNIQTTALAVQEAQEALRLARLRFDAGVGTQTDVINSENSVTEAEGNRVQAIIDYNKALASLFRNVGQPTKVGASSTSSP
jgi:outer membrane protein TolC